MRHLLFASLVLAGCYACPEEIAPSYLILSAPVDDLVVWEGQRNLDASCADDACASQSLCRMPCARWQIVLGAGAHDLVLQTPYGYRNQALHVEVPEKDGVCPGPTGVSVDVQLEPQ